MSSGILGFFFDAFNLPEASMKLSRICVNLLTALFLGRDFSTVTNLSPLFSPLLIWTSRLGASGILIGCSFDNPSGSGFLGGRIIGGISGVTGVIIEGGSVGVGFITEGSFVVEINVEGFSEVGVITDGVSFLVGLITEGSSFGTALRIEGLEGKIPPSPEGSPRLPVIKEGAPVNKLIGKTLGGLIPFLLPKITDAFFSALNCLRVLKIGGKSFMSFTLRLSNSKPKPPITFLCACAPHLNTLTPLGVLTKAELTNCNGN